MLLVIQENLWSESNSLEIAAARAGFDNIKIVKVTPFSGDITPTTVQAMAMTQPTLAFGSTSLMRKAIEKNWQPGVFYNSSFNYTTWTGKWHGNVLNEQFGLRRLGDKDPLPYKEFFVRPAGDLKQFAGEVLSSSDFSEWQDNIVRIDSECDLTPKTLIIVAPVVDFSLMEEYRFFIVGGKPSSYCKFRDEGRLTIGTKNVAVPTDVISFVHTVISMWKPHHTFVLDVCRNKETGICKIVEPNCFNASGLYDCNADVIMRDLKNIIY